MTSGHWVIVTTILVVGLVLSLALPQPFRCQCDEMTGKPLTFEGIQSDYPTCLKMCAAFGPRG